MAGTSDGREIITRLSDCGFNVTASVATSLGGKYLNELKNIDIVTGRLDKFGLCDLVSELKIWAVVDASHPYAQDASKNIIYACHEKNVLYSRFERLKGNYKCNTIYVEDYEEAVKVLNNIEGNILLTTGTNNINKYDNIKDNKNRVFVRTLDNDEAILKCIKAGYSEEHVLCKNGPFSTIENLEHFERFNIKAVVTKDSGTFGGVNEKAEAAEILEIPMIVITRPNVEYENEFQDIDELVEFIKNVM